MWTKRKSSKTKIARKNSNRKKENLSIRYKNVQSKLELKDLRIILHDIAADNLIPSHQQYLITKRINSAKTINKCKINTNNKINPKTEKSSIDDNRKLIHSEIKYASKTIKKKFVSRTIKEHGSKKRKQTKEKDKQLNVDTNPSYTKEQETCSIKSLPSINNDNIEKHKLDINDAVKCTEKHKNTDLSIVTTNCNTKLFSDISKEKVSIPDIHIKNELKNQDLNSKKHSKIDFINDQNLKDKCLDEKMPRKFSKEMQIVPCTSENKKKMELQNSEKPVLPEKTDNILIKNVIVLEKKHDDNNNTQKSNNLQHMNYSTDTVSKVDINESSLVEVHRVAGLTVDNVHAFIENREQSYLLQLQINNSSNIADINVFNSINDNYTNTMLQIKKDGGSASHKKRNWFGQNKEALFNNPSNKKLKLNRTYIQDKSFKTENNFLFKSDNSNSFSKYDNVNISDNNLLQDTDNHITLNSNNNTNSNIPYKVQRMQESIKAGFDAKKDVSNSSYTKFDLENEKNESVPTKEYSTNTENVDKDNLNEARISACSTQLDDQNQVENKTQDDSGDDDCISLYAETFTSRDEIFISNKETEAMTDCKMIERDQNTFDTNIQHNILESTKTLDTITESDISINNKFSNSKDNIKHDNIQRSDISSKEILFANVKTITSIDSVSVNNNKDLLLNNNCNAYNTNIVSNNKAVIQHIEKIQPWKYKKCIKGYCYEMIKNGLCLRKKCYYKHDLQNLIDKIIYTNKQHLTSIIDHLWSLGHIYFLELLYIRTVEELDITSIMNIYEKFYLHKRVRLQFISTTIRALVNKGMNLNHVVSSLCKTLTCNDNLTPYYILTSIKPRIKSDEYWNTLRTLLQFVKPDKEIIETILNDCIINRRNIQDVYINLIKKLHPNEIDQLDTNLMSSFNNLLQHKYQNCYDETSPKSVDNNESFSNKSYKLHSISDLSKPQSLYRNRFWNLHLMLNNLKEKLLHEDYDYVINMLNMYQETDDNQSLYSRCCFRIFCAEIKHSEYHISKIIKRAVQTGGINAVCKVLLDVAIYILTKLVVDEIWIQAYKLMETLQICNMHHDAAFIIMSAEIYLANNQAIKAFMLLKQSNIISTNRKNWNVISNAEDYYLRTKIISILLDALCEESSEYAFFMFQFLVKDQVNSFEPIDLACYVDRLMLTFLTEKETKLIIKMGYLIIEYNFTFVNNVTCRAAIATLVHSDMMLAQRLYQYASGLGIYRTIEISSFIQILINTDWVEEEIYLMFLGFFRRLAMNVGHSIESSNPEQLSIYIMFEDIPTETNLYHEKSYDQEKKQINISKQLVKQVLHTWFNPSLTIIGKVSDTIMKLDIMSVINYLKLLL